MRRRLTWQWLVTYAICAAILIGTLWITLTPRPPLEMQVSPFVETNGTDYDDTILTVTAMELAESYGVTGHTDWSRSALVTFGQWLTYSGESVDFATLDDVTRETPVFVVDGIGRYTRETVDGMVYDRITIALFADTRQIVQAYVFETGSPHEVINVNQPDAEAVRTPSS